MEEDKELLKHIKALGLSSVTEYQKWCKKNGFSTGLNKHQGLRDKEVKFLKDLAVSAAFSKGREKHKPLGKKIQNLLENDNLSLSDIQDLRIKQFLESQSPRLEKKDYREFLEFLQELDKKSKLLKSPNERFSQALGNYQGSNQIIAGLFLIFKNRQKWLKPLKDWECNTKNLTRQFSHLVRYLFTEYKMPGFLDSAWFSGQTQELDWWFWIASGQNIRKANNLPIQLSKKQAHEFLKSPEHYTIPQALRYGQIMGMQEDKRLVEAVLQTPLGRNFENEEFWWSVILLFMNNPMLDRTQLAPMVDYINFQKFSPNAPHPGFNMKGRNPQTLLDQVEEWHSKISKERGKGYMEWKPTGFKAFNKVEKVKEFQRIWTITELTNSKLLSDEGRAMNHCVASYKYSASQGRCSIWSLRCDGERIMTIEVINQTQMIVQVRGKFNKLADGKSAELIRQWAAEAGLGINATGL